MNVHVKTAVIPPILGAQAGGRLSASVVGASSARRRIVAPVWGVRQVAAYMSSACMAGK